MNWETSKPLVIAHRGAARRFPENSLEAVEAAFEAGADGVEVDLRLTKDGTIVLQHDPGLATGRATLGELLRLVNGRFLLNLELKAESVFSDGLEREVCRLLDGYPVETLLLSSFSPLSLIRLRRLAPRLRRGQLFTDRMRPFYPLATPWIAPFSLNVPLRSLTPRLIEKAHRQGRRVFVWTVNREDDIKRCLTWGADGMIKDL